jgi:hypothetical protein
MIAARVGAVFGWNRRAKAAEGEAEAVGLIVGGLLGLLAFLLALTLSQGSNRFSERRLGALTEANAIGTAWLRATAVGDPRAAAIAAMLPDYARQRRSFVTADRGDPALIEIIAGTSAAQRAIWAEMTALLRDRTDPASVAMMASLNEMFDAASAERLALGSTLRPQVFWLLIALAHLGIGAIGYQLALRGQRVTAPTALLVAAWTSVIVVILDLSAPRLGALRVGDDPYAWIIADITEGPPS